MEGTEQAEEPSSWRDEERRRGRRRGILGCLGCGGLGVAGTAVALAVVLGGISSQLEGCEVGAIGDPGPGTESQRLDVDVSPAADLTDGAVVTVESTAFEPTTIVGVAVCLREADTQAVGVDACDEVHGARYATTDDGVLRATYAVPRLIDVQGRTWDCGERPERCVLVAADASDYDRSGGRPISFATDEPAPTADRPAQRPQTDRLPIAAESAGPHAPDQPVRLDASGFQPGEPLLAAWCTEAFATEGPTACEAVDPGAALGAIVFRTLPAPGSVALRADADGRVSTTLAARSTITPYEDGELAPTSTAPDAGTVDCADRAGRCWFVIAAAADTKRSAVLPYELTPG